MRKRSRPIPGLKEALVQLMGGGDEAENAAVMIAELPDPISLLQKFAKILAPEKTKAQATTSATSAVSGEPVAATGKTGSS